MFMRTQRITPFLWFDGRAQEAAEFYTSIFPNSEIISKGDIMSEFSLDGAPFQALNGGPQFKFNEACSFLISCASQEEVDYYWKALTADGGAEGQCGWLKDKFGLSWQVVPERLVELTKSGEPEKIHKMMEALMGMKKLIIEELERAYNG